MRSSFLKRRIRHKSNDGTKAKALPTAFTIIGAAVLLTACGNLDSERTVKQTQQLTNDVLEDSEAAEGSKSGEATKTAEGSKSGEATKTAEGSKSGEATKTAENSKSGEETKATEDSHSGEDTESGNKHNTNGVDNSNPDSNINENTVKADDVPEGKVTAFGDKSTMNNTVGERELPIYCVDTTENKVALSFDAAWGAEDTKEILDILKKHDIHVTFFATGGWVESYPDDVKAVLDAGHDLGNHSENHKNMSELSDEDKKEELMSVHRKVKELTGYDMYLFRPPYGDYDNSVINVAKDCGYYAIQWSVDSLDWQNKGVDSIIDTVINHKNLGNGSIILCHNGADYTASALDELITKLEEAGYEIVPVSELIYADNFYLNYEGRQFSSF